MSKPISVIDLAAELTVDPVDVQVLVDQLISLHGAAAVWIDTDPRGRQFRNARGERFNDLLLTADAATTIRSAIAILAGFTVQS